MIVKFLIACVFAWVCWRLWRGNVRKVYPLVGANDAGDRDARDVLGVAANADVAEIRAAHRRLIASAHPDRGGSAEETRRLNAARDRLLNRGG